MEDSNLRPSRCQRDALTNAELIAHLLLYILRGLKVNFNKPNCLIKNLYEMGIVASFKNLHEMHYPPLSEAR